MAFSAALQYGAFRTGAEMGKQDKETKEQQTANKMIAGLIFTTFPLQYYFGLPAYISAMWALNTVITLAFSQILQRNSVSTFLLFLHEL